METLSPAPSAEERSLLERTAALIVNYNTGDVLLRCLRMLRPTRPGLEAIVVDNGSTDGVIETSGPEFGATTVVEAGRNLGFGRGINLAARQTERDYLLILNPDCFIEPDSIARMAAALSRDPNLGFVGPRIDLESGRPDHACLRNDPDPLGALIYFSRLPRLFPGRPGFNRYSLAHADYDAEQELRAGTAACLLIRASAFRAIDGFDEAFFMYGEDLDLCRRLWDVGRPGRYVPSARALHLKGEASRKQSGRMLVEFHRAMWTYYRKHEQPHHVPPVNWVVAAGITALAGVRLAVNAARREKVVSRR